MNLEGSLKFFACLGKEFQCGVGAAQIVMGEMIVVVALGRSSLREPGNSLLVLPLFDEISSDVVIGISEIRIDLNGLLAFGDRVV